MMELHIEFMSGQYADKIGAEFLRFPDRGSGRDAVSLGFVACRNGAGTFRFHWDDRNRPPSQMRLQLLLDAGEIAIKINVQPLQFRVGIKRIGHGLVPAGTGLILYVLYLLLSRVTSDRKSTRLNSSH